MTCDDCVSTQMELREANDRLRSLQAIIDKRDEHREEIKEIARNAEALMDEARRALAEARDQMAKVRERNNETREMLERLRTYETGKFQ